MLKNLMIHVLCFGNPYLKYDSLAVSIADWFSSHPVKDIEFVKCVSPDEVLNYTGTGFFILDVVKDLEEPGLFDDIGMIEVNRLVSLHDFDLGFFLRLMKETGRMDNVRIIGIPMHGSVEETGKVVIGLIKRNIKQKNHQ